MRVWQALPALAYLPSRHVAGSGSWARTHGLGSCPQGFKGLESVRQRLCCAACVCVFVCVVCVSHRVWECHADTVLGRQAVHVAGSGLLQCQPRWASLAQLAAPVVGLTSSMLGKGGSELEHAHLGWVRVRVCGPVWHAHSPYVPLGTQPSAAGVHAWVCQRLLCACLMRAGQAGAGGIDEEADGCAQAVERRQDLPRAADPHLRHLLKVTSPLAASYGRLRPGPRRCQAGCNASAGVMHSKRGVQVFCCLWGGKVSPRARSCYCDGRRPWPGSLQEALAEPPQKLPPCS